PLPTQLLQHCHCTPCFRRYSIMAMKLCTSMEVAIHSKASSGRYSKLEFRKNTVDPFPMPTQPTDPSRAIAHQLIQKAVENAQIHRAWYGTWMLFRREIKRFLGIIGQTVISPVLSTLLYFLVF